ncbi:hypothetical protein [Bradyrhizobium embrapense]|uniref:hypothetical protein n=1 Tax=Bradyrhizobium embrapense TaxID=630921 RepID=UPI0012F505BE|nr:hypothetical protein [Bradyrhizobium embrapense]
MPSIDAVKLFRWRVELDRACAHSRSMVHAMCNTIVDDVLVGAAQRQLVAVWFSNTFSARNAYPAFPGAFVRTTRGARGSLALFVHRNSPCSQRERRRNVARSPRKQRESESKAKLFRAAVIVPDAVPALE